MWIFLRNSFLSIVECKDSADPKMFLLVRARLRGDIERLFPTAKVSEDGGSDYRFRAWLPRALVAKVLSREVDQIDYGNFKAAVMDYNRRAPAYFAIWLAMAHLQQKALDAERGKGK
jgi:hypothetical protein